MELKHAANHLLTAERLAFDDTPIKAIPSRTGLYAVFERIDHIDHLVYIGRSNNLRSRLRMHLIGPRRKDPKKGPGSMLRNYAGEFRRLCPPVDDSGVWTKYRTHELAQYRPIMDAYIRTLTFTYVLVEPEETARNLEKQLTCDLKPEFNHGVGKS